MATQTKRNSKSMQAQLSDLQTEFVSSTPATDVTPTDVAPSQPTPIAAALVEQGKALATTTEHAALASHTASNKQGALKTAIDALLTLQDTEAQHVLEQAASDLKTMALATMGCAVADATPDQLTDAADHCWKSFNMMSTMVRRQNKGKVTEAPKFGLCYLGFDKAECTATIRVIAKPTEAQLRTALKDDVRALNAALQSEADKASKAKSVKASSESDDVKQEDGHIVLGQGVQSITALAAVLDLVKGWRPSELAVCAATLNHMALAGRLALDPENATLKAEADAARLSVVLLTSAYQTEKAEELKARNAAADKQAAELLALRTENARKAREALLAEEQALDAANAALAARMAASPSEPAPVPTTTESPVESTGELVEPNGDVLKSA